MNHTRPSRRIRPLRWMGLALVAALGTTSLGAGAQPRADKSGTLSSEARILFEKGVAAAQKGKWQDSYAALFSAWNLRRHYQIAGNLGLAELKLGKFRDAAEHLSFAIVEGGKDQETLEMLAVHRARLAEASAQIVTLTVHVSEDGARVVVDGVEVGDAPLSADVFLEIGKHTVSATKTGFARVTQEIDAGKGEKKVLQLTLVREGVVPVPSTSASAVAPPPSASATPSTPPAGSWPRTEVIVGGAVLSGLALGGAVVTTVLANGKAGERDDLRQSLLGQGASACAGASPASGCSDLASLNSDKDTWTNWAVPLYVVSGASAAGVLVILLATSDPEAATASQSDGFKPWASADGFGLSASGRF
jgi:hypothetical protein